MTFMTSDTNVPLLVPMELEALVVNNQVRLGANFQRWQMNYNALSRYISPEPPAFSGIDSGFATNPANNGVYLHWTLPAALRHGTQQNETGEISFPLVPNRWLVVRYNGAAQARKATAWIVESDFTDSNAGTSVFINPFPQTSIPQPTRIGRKLEGATWSETGSQQLFLTAVAPGNLNFSAYQPYHKNVFSIHDTLDGVSDTDTISYFVAGWYSDPGKDILAGALDVTDFNSLLQSLNWTVNQAGTTVARSTIYHGMVYGVGWNKTGAPPASDKPANASAVTVAIGNNSIDALTALITQAAINRPGIDAALLEAFQYDMLSLLDTPDGEAALQQKIHEAWFNGMQAGYVWEIADNPENAPGQVAATVAELEAQAQWLAVLNQQQQQYDDGVSNLASLQSSLYLLWWKKQYIKANNLPYPTGSSQQQFDQQFNPANTNGLLYRVKQLMDTVAALSTAIPMGSTQALLQQSINAYTTQKNLPPTRLLKRAAKPSFFLANDPVVLLSGLKSNARLTDDAPVCRLASQLITSFLLFNEYSVTADSLTGINWGIPANMPVEISGLLTEFFLLDPGNAAMIVLQFFQSADENTIAMAQQQISARDAYTGNLPDIDLNPWKQPWTPMFLTWEANYYPIPFTTNNTNNWNFDGSTYNWNGNNAKTTNMVVLKGSALITPQCNFNLQSRLTSYLDKNPDAPLQQLNEFIAQIDNWDILSQSLNGFTHQLCLLDPSGNIAPDNQQLFAPWGLTLAQMTTLGSSSTLSLSNPVKPQPFIGWPPSLFQQCRAGQWYFTQLAVTDRFGQTLQVVNNSNALQFKPVITTDMIPVHKVPLQGALPPFIQLPPRMLQPSRLHFNFVDAKDDTKILSQHAGTNPVCAWIIYHHLDNSITAYNNTGGALGKISLAMTDSQLETVYWQPLPGSTYATLQHLVDAPALYHLGRFLTALAEQGPVAFRALVKTIDEVLSFSTAAGLKEVQNLSYLAGQPLALTRTMLRFELAGLPVSDPGWQYTFAPPTPDYLNYTFNVALGNTAIEKDGLIGYFSGNNYNRFNVTGLEGNAPYIVPIGSSNFISLVFNQQTPSYVTMLMLPRSSVHATSSILPVVTLEIPPAFVNDALANMEVCFNTGPLLTGMQLPGAGNEDTGIIMPRPTEKNGVWTWTELSSNGWQSLKILPADQLAHLSATSPVLRTGILQLTDAFKENKDH